MERQGFQKEAEAPLSYAKLMSQARAAISEALEKMGLTEEIELSEVPAAELGDLGSPVALLLSKKLRRSPREIAEDIKTRIDLTDKDLIERVQVAGGGYINFFLNVEKFARDLIGEVIEKGASYGSSDLGRGRRVQVEHMNSNPNKAMHIGTARNTCLGDSLVRILRFTGHEVYSLNYVDDSGAQMADYLVGHFYLGMPLEPPPGMKFDHYAGKIYVDVNKLYETRPDLREEKAHIIRVMEEGTSKEARLARELALRVGLEQARTCWRMNIFFNLWNWETDILHTNLFDLALKKLKESGRVKKIESGPHEGCTVLDLQGIPEYSGLEKQFEVLIRSDGTVMYVSKDIAYAMWKLGILPDVFKYMKIAEQPNGETLWSTTSAGEDISHPDFAGVDLAISVIDVRQSHEQNIVKTALKIASGEAKRNYVHYAYEVVSLSGRTARQMGVAIEDDAKSIQMAGRKGIVVDTDDVLDALRKKALDETRKRNPTAEASWLEGVAEKVAVAALRYDLTKQDNDKVIIFDMDDALDLQGETGPYIQYAYARASRILEKAGAQSEILSDFAKLQSPHEKKLMIVISKFPELVMEAAKNLDPQAVTKYAYQLATTFNEFYERCPVIHAENPELTAARLELVKAFKTTVRSALSLIGIDAIEKM
jgi:arginyl-tRNA synthetase